MMTPDTLAAAHEELGDLEETIRDLEMYAGLLAAADTDDGTARAGGKILDLIKEVERVREKAWHATGRDADRPAEAEVKVADDVEARSAYVFDRKAVASRAHDAVDLARSLVMALRGAEERLEGVGSGKGAPHPSDEVAVDLMALGALGEIVADKMNEIASDLHG